MQGPSERLSVPVSDVQEIDYLDRGRGALHGMAVAGTIGAILGAVALPGWARAMCGDETGKRDCDEVEAGIVGGLVGGVSVGVVLGLPIGVAIGSRDRFVVRLGARP